MNLLSLTPLGDQAALAAFAEEGAARRLAAAVRRLAPPWLIDVVPAYTTVAVFFDLEQTTFAAVAAVLDELTATPDPADGETEGRRLVIPCCYSLNQDLDRVARHTGLSAEEVVRRHSATEYIVCALGFCPGFPYLGYLPPALCGVPRLESPRLRVPAGSVGLTGRQTGIYPEPRPGGWNLIGRTPLVLVDVADGYFPLRVGDRVRFDPIDEAAFRRLEGRRL